MQVVGCSSENQINIEKTLLKLLPHLTPNEFILCGGIAIRHHVISHGKNFGLRDSNDLDLLISSPKTLNPSVMNDFMVVHYHIYPKGLQDDNFYVQLANVETKIKADIFDYEPYYPEDPIEEEFNGVKVKMRNIEDQLVTSVLEGARILTGASTEPKKFDDIDMLLSIADVARAESYWRKKRINKHTTSLVETYELMKKYREANPDKVVERDHFAKREPYMCNYCADMDGFKVTPMAKAFELMQ